MTEPMNPAQIAAMVADREAGTPGKWVVGFREDGSSYLSIGGLEPGQAHSQGNIFFHTDYPRDIANASRIARITDLEVMVITQAAELARVRAAIAVKGGTEHAPTEWAYLKACETIRSRDRRIAALTEALEDTLDFLEWHSNRWNGYGPHPQAIAETARATLTTDKEPKT
jgi:hypothetical protein